MGRVEVVLLEADEGEGVAEGAPLAGVNYDEWFLAAGVIVCCT